MNQRMGSVDSQESKSFYVHLVESPSPEDFRANRLETKAIAAQLELLDIPYTTHLAVNPVQFRTALLEDVVNGMKRFQLPPLIHLSTHGSSDGIQLTDQRPRGEFLTWNELADILRPIHKAVNGGIGVCMSCCGGIHGRKMAQVLDSGEVPFTWLIGTTNEADVRDLALGFSVFYRALQRGQNAEQIISAMRTASGIADFKLESGTNTQQVYAKQLTDTMNQIIADLQEQQGRTSAQSSPLSNAILGLAPPKLGTP